MLYAAAFAIVYLAGIVGIMAQDAAKKRREDREIERRLREHFQLRELVMERREPNCLAAAHWDNLTRRQIDERLESWRDFAELMAVSDSSFTLRIIPDVAEEYAARHWQCGDEER